MRRAFAAVLIVAAVSTSGCAVLRGKQAAPDEFAVARNAPLIIPPDFNLTPPVAGTAGLTADQAQQQAIDALFGGPAPRSASETSMLDAAGRERAQIGIRSTRIRTLDRTVLTVPNGEFSSLHIENYSHRDRFWFHPTLHLRYETTPEQMRRVLQALREMLAAHPKIEYDSARVRLIGLAAYSVDVEIFAYARTSDNNEFLAIQEELLLNCMQIVEDCGTGFAFPSRMLYLGQDGGIGAADAHNKLARAAE